MAKIGGLAVATVLALLVSVSHMMGKWLFELL